LSWLWRDVQAEMARDPRIIETDRLFEGAPRRCWRATGGLSPAASRHGSAGSHTSSSAAANATPASTGSYASSVRSFFTFSGSKQRTPMYSSTGTRRFHTGSSDGPVEVEEEDEDAEDGPRASRRGAVAARTWAGFFSGLVFRLVWAGVRYSFWAVLRLFGFTFSGLAQWALRLFR
jgi:hypothetical protein